MIALQERVHNAAMPDDWKLSKLRQVFKTRTGNKNLGMKEQNLLSLSYGKIKRKDINSNDGLLPASFETYQVVEEGNIVMRLTDLQNDKRSLRQGLVTERGIITSAYDALEIAPDHSSRFWQYALLALDLAKYYYTLGGGVRQSIKFNDFPNDWIYCPRIDRQKDIADFLDRETARIDLLIEKKKQLQGFLVEKYLALVGQFYSEAETYRFERVAEQVCRPINQSYTEEVIPIGLLNRGRGIFSKDKTQIHELGDSDFFYVEQGDLVFSGQFAWEGAVALVGAAHNQCVASHRYPIFASKSGVKNAYLFALFRTRHGNFILNDCSRGAAGRNRPLNVNRLRKWEIPIPSETVQRKVADMVELEQKSNKQIQLSMEKLTEYRTALITAAVTGQIDVKSYGKSGAVNRHPDRLQDGAGHDG